MFFLRVEIAAKRRFDSQDLKKPGSDPSALQFLGKLAGRLRCVFRIESGNRFESLVQLVPILNTRWRYQMLLRKAGASLGQLHQAIAVRKRQRTQQDRIDGGEHGAVRPNTEG